MPKYENYENKINSTLIERRMKKNQMERNIRRSKMLFQHVRTFLAFCCAVALCLGVLKFSKMSSWYLKPNIFDTIKNNPQLELEGNLVANDLKILSALRQIELPHKPIYLLETKEIEEKLKQLAPIENAYIRRFAFPAKLVIRVEEKIPVLTISPKEDVKPIAFFTSCGTLIGRDFLPLPKQYPTYLVLSYGTKGDDYHNWDAKKVNKIVSLAKEIEKLSDEKIEYIDWRNPKDVYIKLETSLVRIGEVDETVNARIKNIKSLLSKVNELKNKKIKYIDLRWETNYLKLDSSTKVAVPSSEPKEIVKSAQKKASIKNAKQKNVKQIQTPAESTHSDVTQSKTEQAPKQPPLDLRKQIESATKTDDMSFSILSPASPDND